MQIVIGAESLFEQLKEWRRYLHQYSELSFEEEHSASFVVRTLEMFPNIEIEEGVGGYGVVGTLTTGRGPTIALRADMDALPIQEENDNAYISKYDGVMHACGHDGHTAML